MVSVKDFKPGDAVRDRKLHLEWVVVGTDHQGALLIERNGVTVTASKRDVEPIASVSSGVKKRPNGG